MLQKACADKGTRVVFIDATFVLPTSTENIVENFNEKRIQDAVFFDIKAIADKTSPLPHMLPDTEQFSAAMSALGIRNDDLLITYGQHSMVVGPARAWWMFKGFGHHNVVVLNGNLPAWESANLPLDHNPPTALAPSTYTATTFNPQMVIGMHGVLEASNDALCPIIDARPAQRFHGESPEPRAGMRAGHMPNASSVPSSALTDEHGLLKSREQLTALFEQDAIITQSKDSRIITTCGSGITACALALALYHLDHHNVAVYDGSWSEWGLERSATPISTT